MENYRISEKGIDKNSLIYRSNPKYDYCDVFHYESKNFVVRLRPEECMISFFQAFPPFFLKLLQTREFIAKRIGLKTSPIPIKKDRENTIDKFRADVGDTLGIFEVLGKNEHEILTGQNDKHLDFRLSFFSYGNDIKNIEIATTVSIHNKLGRMYFFIVKPIHRYYMKKILARMIAKMKNADS